MLGGTCDLVLFVVSTRYNRDCESCRGARTSSESLVPAVGGDIVVARGFGLCIGASEGWGGGVAK